MNPLAENANQYQPPKITVLMPVYNVSKFYEYELFPSELFASEDVYKRQR